MRNEMLDVLELGKIVSTFNTNMSWLIGTFFSCVEESEGDETAAEFHLGVFLDNDEVE